MGKFVREFNKWMSAMTKDFREEFEKGLQGKTEKQEEKKEQESAKKPPASGEPPKAESKQS